MQHNVIKKFRKIFLQKLSSKSPIQCSSELFSGATTHGHLLLLILLHNTLLVTVVGVGSWACHFPRTSDIVRETKINRRLPREVLWNFTGMWPVWELSGNSTILTQIVFHTLFVRIVQLLGTFSFIHALSNSMLEV